MLISFTSCILHGFSLKKHHLLIEKGKTARAVTKHEKDRRYKMHTVAVAVQYSKSNNIWMERFVNS